MLSPQRLALLINQHHLYANDRDSTAEHLIARMRSEIEIRLADAGYGFLTFTVRFSNPDAKVASRVAWDLAEGTTLKFQGVGSRQLVFFEILEAPPVSIPFRDYRSLYLAALLAASLAVWEGTLRLRHRFTMAWAGWTGNLPQPN
jgi:hypothetical protein